MKIKIFEWKAGPIEEIELRYAIGREVCNSDRDGHIEDVDNKLGKVTNAFCRLLENLCEKNVVTLDEVASFVEMHNYEALEEVK